MSLETLEREISMEPSPGDLQQTQPLDCLARLLVGQNLNDCVALTYIQEKTEKVFYVATNQKSLDAEKLPERFEKLVHLVVSQPRHHSPEMREYLRIYAPRPHEQFTYFKESLRAFCRKDPFDFRSLIPKIVAVTKGKIKPHEAYVHAEIALVDAMDDRVEGKKVIGLSKLCCQACFYVLKKMRNDVMVRGGSGNRFGQYKITQDHHTAPFTTNLGKHGKNLRCSRKHRPDYVSRKGRRSRRRDLSRKNDRNVMDKARERDKRFWTRV